MAILNVIGNFGEVVPRCLQSLDLNRTSDFGFRTSDFGFYISDRLQTSDRLPTSFQGLVLQTSDILRTDFGLQISVFGLGTSGFGKTSDFGLRTDFGFQNSGILLTDFEHTSDFGFRTDMGLQT